jgi:hypothetical protein
MEKEGLGLGKPPMGVLPPTEKPRTASNRIRELTEQVIPVLGLIGLRIVRMNQAEEKFGFIHDLLGFPLSALM